MNVLTWVLGALFLMGCGSGGESAPPVEVATFNGQEYRALDTTALTRSDSLLSGTGTVLFRYPVPEKNNHFDLAFELNEGSEFTLVVHASNDLSGPLGVVFGRKNDALTIAIRDGDQVTAVQGDFNAPLSASGKIELKVDVHDHGHLVFWAGGEKQHFFVNNPLTAKFWGLILKDAQVTRAVLGPAQHKDN